MIFMKKWPKKAQFSQIKMTSHISIGEKRLTRAAIFLFAGLFTFSSCKKVESDLGLDVLPSSDQLNLEVDTIEVNTYSTLEDSLRSDEFSSNMLGSYNDPIFGKVKASTYAQIRLSTNPTTADFGTSPIVDSVVLSLNISGHYGNQDDQTFEVYQITEDIYRDSSYFTNSVKTNNGINLVKTGFGTFTPSVFGKPVIDGDTLDPQIRLRLNETFGDMIINSGALIDETTFAAYFKGIFITVNNPSQASGEGGVYNLDMENDETQITIYYHNTTDTLKFEMPVNDKSAHFTSMEHDYTGTKIAQQLADSTLGNEYFYVQAGQGVVGNVSIPNLLNLLEDGPVLINKAQLYLPVQYYSVDPFTPPTRMVAYGLDEEGAIYNMPDFNLGVSIYGGNYDDDKKAYSFNILRYVNDVLRGDVMNNPIRLAPTSSVVTVNRTVLSGKNSPHREKPYLVVYYTKYE